MPGTDLSLLRSERIDQSTDDPLNVPCVDVADERLQNRRPLVSVCMQAYNHADYIGRSIDGVLAQETDFDYELVICEDYSQDKTREICFSYQRRHPDEGVSLMEIACMVAQEVERVTKICVKVKIIGSDATAFARQMDTTKLSLAGWKAKKSLSTIIREITECEWRAVNHG